MKCLTFNRVFLFVTLTTLSAAASALGRHTVYNFILDTSVQRDSVIIQKPIFRSDPQYDFNNYVKCESRNHRDPIRISGMDEGYYNCTQTSELNLKKNQSYLLNNSIHINANGKDLIITDSSYEYDPWNEGKFDMHLYLIYINEQGQLAYRDI